jgi:hypothetical protein
MQIDAVGEALDVRVESTFRASDVMLLQNTVAALVPFSRLTIDFSAVRQCDDAALADLARVLVCLPKGEVAIRGLTAHQSRLLTYLKLNPNRPDASSASA